jgi:hypothetical protein
MKETYLLLNGELDYDHYDAFFYLEEKKTDVLDEVFFICSLHQKYFNNSTFNKYKLGVFTDRVIMKIFRLKRDEVTACWRKDASKRVS